MSTGDLIVTDTKLGVGTSDNLSTLTVRAKTSFTLSGTLSRTETSATVAGVSTLFLSELAVGDRIRVGPDFDDDETRTVTAIASNTSLTVDHPYTTTAAGQASLARPSAIRVDDETGGSQVVVTDQGSIGIGTMAPDASLHLSGPGAGDWRGCPVNLKIHSPEDGDAWGIVLTTGPDGENLSYDQGAAIWVDNLPDAGGSTLTFTLTDANYNEMDVLRIDGTGVSMPMGLTTSPTLVSTDYGLDSSDHYVYVDAGASGRTITLPLASSNYGRVIWIFKSAGAGAVTVAPSPGDQINGVAANKTISTAFAGLKLIALTSTWAATVQTAA